ncbi:hypothetical protein QE152_g22052 [Popillia japonica]|uniref:Uncharacterized protein n=1 Tax=Popillia japonica TaxID=7064 RepID=A0AAW1KM28_POPJA
MNETGQDEEEAEVLSCGQTELNLQPKLREDKGAEVNTEDERTEEYRGETLSEVSELKEQKRTRTIPKYLMNYKLY